jgi:hypothetical protein
MRDRFRLRRAANLHNRHPAEAGTQYTAVERKGTEPSVLHRLVTHRNACVY